MYIHTIMYHALQRLQGTAQQINECMYSSADATKLSMSGCFSRAKRGPTSSCKRSFLCLAQTPSVGRETIDNFSQASPVPSRLMTKKATIGKAHDTHISRDDGVETATVLEY
jgi:hypothetical protein